MMSNVVPVCGPAVNSSENARWGSPAPLPMDAAPPLDDDMSSAVLLNAFLPASSRDKL